MQPESDGLLESLLAEIRHDRLRALVRAVLALLFLAVLWTLACGWLLFGSAVFHR
jgi:hypothetical protein